MKISNKHSILALAALLLCCVLMFTACLQGEQGIQGEKGDKGDQGPQGVQGVQGVQGPQGIQGEKGDTGAQGIQGDKGDKGDTGVGIVKVEIVDGELMITYSNGTVVSAGSVNGAYNDDPIFDFYPHPDGTYAVMAGESIYMEEIVIPATYQGKAVTKILSNAFQNAPNLEIVIIPDSVTSIDEKAFSDCSLLTTVTLGDSVTSIGGFAFGSCTSLKKVYYTGTVEDWCNISFSNASSNPMYFGEELYFNNLLVTEVEIPDTITKINDYAFRGCTSLTSITIPDSVTSIGNNTFNGCTGLTSITLGDSVTSIGSAFYGCTSLKTVYYTGTAEQWAGISIGSNNSYLTNATRYYYSETQPATSGNYWRYVNGVPTAW